MGAAWGEAGWAERPTEGPREAGAAVHRPGGRPATLAGDGKASRRVRRQADPGLAGHRPGLPAVFHPFAEREIRDLAARAGLDVVHYDADVRKVYPHAVL